MGSISLLRHHLFALHRNPELHPESSERLTAIDYAIAQSDLAATIVPVTPRAVTPEELCQVHAQEYIEELEAADAKLRGSESLIQLDGDTFMSEHTLAAAKLAAGGGLVATELVVKGGMAAAFAAVRPPGHHARKGKPMGFCIFNNIALAAHYARLQLSLKRVLILDWDVHHGNGTEEIFYNDASVCVISLHQYPFWPYDSGWLTEDGAGEGKGFNINIPLPAGTGDSGYMRAWERIVEPIGLSFKPELILLSAGYDAHQLDPLGQQKITTVGFALLSQKLSELSTMTGAKVVAFLEGGYNQRALAESVVATLRVLSCDTPTRLAEVQDSYKPSASSTSLKPVSGDTNPIEVDERIDLVRQQFRQYWPGI